MTSDLGLIDRARGDDPDAIEALYLRHHEPALRYARSLTDPVTAEDVVAEAFVRVLETLRGGGGPTLAFRPYLLRAVRNVHVSHVRGDSRFVWIEDDLVEDDATARDELDDRRESAVLAEAFASLPERWQAVLWHTAVEDEDHASVGRMLGIKANAVAALGYRARDGLRRAYLSAHLAAVRDEACRPYREQLPSYVRGGLRKQHRSDVELHLQDCVDCSAGALELSALNSQLGAVLAPAVLGVTATGYAATATGAGGGLGQVGPVTSWARRLRHPVVVAGTAAATAATAVAATAFVLVQQRDPDPAASAPQPAHHSASSVVPPSVPATVQPTTSDRGSPSAAPFEPDPVLVPTAVSPPAAPGPTITGPAGLGSLEVTPIPADSATLPISPTPSTPPTPTASTTPSPSYLTVEDLVLAGGQHAYYAPHHHLEAIVTAPVPTVLTLDVLGYQSHAVHLDRDFVGTTCAAGPTSGNHSTLTCTLAPGQGTFAIDLVVDGPLDVVARVSAPENGDPDPSNDAWVFTS